MKNLIAFTLLVTFSSISLAEEFWTAPLHVEEVSAWYQSGKNRMAIKTAEPITKENGAAVSGCSLGDSENLVGYYNDNNINERNRLIYSTALNAYNLNSKVQLYMETSCNSIVGWDLHGIKAVQ